MDKQLLEKLYDAYYQEIYLYVYALCKNHEWAADLTQETFLKALLSLDQSHTNMRAWLYTVARNLYYNEVSKNRRVMYVDEYEKIFCRKKEIACCIMRLSICRSGSERLL